ncbi:MAG TPA: PQQ-binding-like beta-propeller repeat protein [Thermoanaerobaculia bacterium]|jgi:outer membrane protein assembly factor BamB|nr:PQQ-binding-like beta-propeller repeat protein [Thermoanaerobaculia bacterium]
MTTQNWWMFHGDPAHTGEVTTSNINSTNAAGLQMTQQINVQGSILSTPAVVDGFIYVGLANSHTPGVPSANGGTMLKIGVGSGQTVAEFNWEIDLNERDSHGFAGMGCTPAVVDGKVYFSAFDGALYCLNAADMTLAWKTQLRWDDPAHKQPIRNVRNYTQAPQAAGWSSPVVANGRVWVGIGEGENPDLFSFVYCLDASTGDVIWIFSTCQYVTGVDNKPNVLPADFVAGQLPPGFTVTTDGPVTKGSSVWASIAFDPQLDSLYCATGNPQPDSALPSAGYSNGVLILAASSGAFKGFVQFPPDSSYRPSDIDVDVGGSPTLFTRNGKKVVGIGCKNGSYMVFDAETFAILNSRQMLPYMKDGTQIPSVDPHGPDTSADPNPSPTNAESNHVQAENFHGTYSTAALCSPQQKLFIGVGGNNYHYVSSGIDFENTPFMRALDWNTLADAWPMAGDPEKYTNAGAAMYQNPGESGISVPAVVNDVVFMATTQVALYAFSAKDGTLLWSDMNNFGGQTMGFNGGYGYCMGPAVWGDYVIAGALVAGRDGGVLNIYKLPS